MYGTTPDMLRRHLTEVNCGIGHYNKRKQLFLCNSYQTSVKFNKSIKKFKEENDTINIYFGL